MNTDTFPIPPSFQQQTNLTTEQYETLYRQSIEDPDTFWREQAKRFLDFSHPFDTVLEENTEENTVNWFKGGKTNACYNCVDRHLDTQPDKTALIFESDDGSRTESISYLELHQRICQSANLLKQRGVKKGDRVCIYLPMIPDAVITMLACARIGAVHCVVFAGFSAKALKERIQDAECKVVITAETATRGGKTSSPLENARAAIEASPSVHTCLVVTSGGDFQGDEIYIDYNAQVATQSLDCPPETMDAEDPLFILYTSGSTGKPKGVLHTTAGYLLGATMTFYYVFDYREDDIYWCTADVGWITGHSYMVYGPMANGATSLIHEGVPNYPDASRCWQIVDKHKVSLFYTAPTAIRALMAEGDCFLNNSSRDSLRLLGSVGEPINPEVWLWYYEQVGKKHCAIVDTWWQTETGAIMISPLPGAIAPKPGFATRPFFGVQPVILDERGNELEGEAEGILAIKSTWPSQLRTLYGNHERFAATYLAPFKGYYATGDGAKRDTDGYYQITGRCDDVLNVSGHRLGTAEIESAIVVHHDIAEAAVVGVPDAIKGEAIYAFVKPLDGITPDDELKQAVIQTVVKEISPIAKPATIQWASDLPKTRSGKIMRRILRKIASGDTETLGDISTLASPEVVDTLIKKSGKG